MPRKKKQKATGSYNRQARGIKRPHRKKPLRLPPDLMKKVKR